MIWGSSWGVCKLQLGSQIDLFPELTKDGFWARTALNPDSAIDLLPGNSMKRAPGPLVCISDRFWRAYSHKHGLMDDLTFNSHPFFSTSSCQALYEGLDPYQLPYQSDYQTRIVSPKSSVTCPRSQVWFLLGKKRAGANLSSYNATVLVSLTASLERYLKCKFKVSVATISNSKWSIYRNNHGGMGPHHLLERTSR